MSSKKDTMNEYRRTKKMNKLKIHSEQKNKNSFIYSDENFNNTNELPYGAFDKKLTVKNDPQFVVQTNVHPNVYPNVKNDIENNVENDDEYETFDADYFEPIPYVKK